jgi:hypothetical protein
MVRFLGAFVAGLLCLGLVAGATADDTKKDDKKAVEKELKGSAMCAKCELKDKDFKKCQTVLVVKEDGKEVKYYFDEASHKKHHSDYCTGKHEVTVKAKVTEKDGKKWLSVSKLEKKDKA